MVRVKFAEWMDGRVIDGCKRVGNELHFPTAKTKAEALALINKAGRNSQIGFSIQTKAVAGTELDTLKAQFPDINFDSGKVFKCIAANTLLDREIERFSKEILDLFASQIIEDAKTVMWQHDRNTHGLGMMFAATVVGAKQVGEYELLVYLLIDNESRIPEQGERKLALAIENSYVKNVSIGFRAWGEYIEQNYNGENRYIYTYGINPERPESKGAYVREISFVDLGAQFGAATTKGAKDIEFIDNLNMTKTVDFEIGGTKHTLTFEVAGDTVTVKGEAEIATAIKAVTDKCAALETSLKAFREPLEADVVNAKLTGFDEATVKALSDAKLIELAKEVTKGVKPDPKTTQPLSETEKAVSSLKF